MGSVASEIQMNEETLIRILYHNLLHAWNKKSAADMADLFLNDGTIVGFDGSQIRGKSEIEKNLSSIFFDHATATYVSKIRNIKWISPDVAILSAISGMIPSGQNDINPEMNAVQALLTVKENKHWKIAFFQNTPAVFHGHPEMREKLSRELRDVLKEENISENSAQGF
ncbi:MAG: SgcJ/EcaC family oxidoreductase [Bdellovibrio sp.]